MATNFFTKIMRIPPNIFQRGGRERGDYRKKSPLGEIRRQKQKLQKPDFRLQTIVHSRC